MVFHEKGGLILDAQLIVDNDVVYVADKDDVATDNQGKRNRLHVLRYRVLRRPVAFVPRRVISRSAAFEWMAFCKESVYTVCPKRAIGWEPHLKVLCFTRVVR